jgi:hypothetical protein
MPFLSLIAIAALQAAAAPPAPAPEAEPSCSYVTGDRAHPAFADDPNLHVIAQTAADGRFAPTPPAGAFAIVCSRSSIVPAEHDEEVILAHLALIVTEAAGPMPHRSGALGFGDGQFRFTMRSGSLTPGEQAEVNARLATFLARVHPSSAPAH